MIKKAKPAEDKATEPMGRNAGCWGVTLHMNTMPHTIKSAPIINRETNTQRQPTLSINNPAYVGPTVEDTVAAIE